MERERIEALEGKTIKVLSDYEKYEFQGFIAHFDADIGITIIDAEDCNRYLYCARGPASPEGMEFAKANKEQWTIFLKLIIPVLESGVLDLEEFDIKLRKATGIKSASSYLEDVLGHINPSTATCSFGQ